MTICYTQLMIIVGLCLDDGKSFTSRFFNTKVMQFLGRISMSIYLFHFPLILYISGIFVYSQNNLNTKEINMYIALVILLIKFSQQSEPDWIWKYFGIWYHDEEFAGHEYIEPLGRSGQSIVKSHVRGIIFLVVC